MGLTAETSRLAKLFIDAEGLTDSDAEARLKAMTLEIIVGQNADSIEGHHAILTALAVGQRTFAGGVKVILNDDCNLRSHLPLKAKSIGDALKNIGATEFDNEPSVRILIGDAAETSGVDAFAWWDGWRAGSTEKPLPRKDSGNPLAGIAAGAACVARAFGKLRGKAYPSHGVFDLWPTADGLLPPPFPDTFLPGELWIMGLGNLGQAMLWSLAALPYTAPSEVKLVLQDRDRISAENWGTSILVRRDDYGAYKTQVGEAWCSARGFDVRRTDRWVDANHRIQDGDPRIAVCGFDNEAARKLLDSSGYDLIVDAGLGRGHADFERVRISIFDEQRRVADHFLGGNSSSNKAGQDYEKLMGLDACGAALFGQVAVAAPYVSAIAGAIAVSRMLAISSGSPVPRNETRRLSQDEPRLSNLLGFSPRGLVRIKQH